MHYKLETRTAPDQKPAQENFFSPHTFHSVTAPPTGKTPLNKQQLGALGEDLACDYLQKTGYTILARNWRDKSPRRLGELDIIARDGRTIVAVEVKTRSGLQYGSPLDAITGQKLRRLRALILTWRKNEQSQEKQPGKPLRGGGLRIDAIGIVFTAGQKPRLNHLQGIW